MGAEGSLAGLSFRARCFDGAPHARRDSAKRGAEMRHFVFWVPEADEKLQAIITATNASNDLIRIVREIDFWLARDPLDFGE
jgi:hypothetical protein